MSQQHGEENAAGAGSSRVLLRTLAPHYLCGDVLDSLTLSQLVHTLHVPYGPAVILIRDIARLTQRYPKPPTSTSPEDDPTTTTSIGRAMHPSYWLEVHDQEYYHKEHKDRTPHHFAGMPHDDDDPIPATPPPAIDPELEKRLATLMKERYGIELPTIRRRTSTRQVPHKDQNDDDDNKTSSLCDEDNQQDGPHCGLGNDQFTSSRNSSRLVPPILEPSHVTTSPQGPSNHHGLPPPATLLENMPPRIREIAERRPDLVQALLLKQQQHQPQTQQQPRRRPPPKQPDDEEEEMEDEMDDDETTSLVQRRPRRPYKPTEGEIV